MSRSKNGIPSPRLAKLVRTPAQQSGEQRAGKQEGRDGDQNEKCADGKNKQRGRE